MSYPCWLTADQLEQADALLKLGFCYCGNADDFCQNYFLCKIHSWKFHSAYGEICLDAVCHGALYSWCLETMPNQDEDNFFENRLKEAKTALNQVIRKQNIAKEISAKQLSLFGY